MSRYTRNRWLVAGAWLLTAGAAVGLQACNSDGILKVTDPDIINPQDVNSADGAIALQAGAVGRFASATTAYAGGNAETVFLLGGLLADEWRSSDTFSQRDETDKRLVQTSNANNTTANRNLLRARVAALQAIGALRAYAPAPTSNVGQMFYIIGYSENLSGETYCDGMVFSDPTPDGKVNYGTPITGAEAFTRAAAWADSALANVGGTKGPDVANAARVLKGRALLNLGKYAEAAAAVASVPDTFMYVNTHSQTSMDNANWAYNYNQKRYTVADKEGGNGLPFISANDPRVPVAAQSGNGFDTNTPWFAQKIWSDRAAPGVVASGIEAQLIIAEAQLKGAYAGDWLATLNALRTKVNGLAPLTDPGTDAARQDLLFQERAFWMFGTGHRLGDLRRLVRQYQRPVESVFPTGAFFKGGQYGPDVNLPIPQAEENNPNFKGCLNRNA
jgi:hypothetical protein